jgi:peptidoglycan L-alanyl-D-glutamate endopeptidase CwlK
MLNERSEAKLEGVHADLAKVARRAAEICEIEFIVTEGLRTMKRQRALMAAGASKTLKSRHLTGHAIDVAPLIDGEVRWDWPPFFIIADAMKAAAAELGVAIEWGGDWRGGFKDGPHFQLPWSVK